MTGFLRQAAVVARRDFMAVVFTPTFLIFLLAPLFMIAFGVVGGTGASRIATNASKLTRIAAIVEPDEVPFIKGADERLRKLYPADLEPPELLVVSSHGAGDADVAANLLRSTDVDHVAVLYGGLSRPTIQHSGQGERSANYLAEIAERALRDRASGIAPNAGVSRPNIETVAAKDASLRGRQVAAYGAVFVIFFLTLLLAGQAVGMLAEEKSNKVIEVLAAAAPLESVFLGKLVGMFGVALLFVTFWGGIAVAGLVAASSGRPAMFAPAIGAPAFLMLCAVYFGMAYMLLGAVFLGIGAQASTMREIQMLSLPITIFQMAMFGLSMAAVGSPGEPIARVAEIVPFSSPFAMAARGATDPAIWPHLAAIGWQLLWVGIIIWISARLFRLGVLKAGGGPVAKLGRWLSGTGRG
jgi:ABC-2 type transport system permease protein